jgi:hypothetical protein
MKAFVAAKKKLATKPPGSIDDQSLSGRRGFAQ